ncbi:uncharacterized protein K452DRAFT_199557, partial [Aplosporella prunicola CBS 121167]
APASSTAPLGFDPASFPDGGRAAWLCALGSFCALFCSFGWINAIGVFQDYYGTHQLAGYPASTIAWIPSLETFMMFFGGPIVGKLYDNHGPRYLLLVGSILHVLGLMMASLATRYYQFLLAQGVCSPIGASMVFYPSMSALSTWFFRRRALAFGIMTAGSSLGGVVFPLMVDELVRTVGFAWAMRGAAFLILGLLIIANATITSRLPPSPKSLTITEYIHPFTYPPFSLLTTGAFIFFLGLFLPFTFLPAEARAAAASPALIRALLPALNAASLFGRLLPGWAADKVGRFNVAVVVCAFSAVTVLALWIPAGGTANTSALLAFAILYGFGSGAVVSLAPALVAQISDVRAIGVRSGAFFAVVALAALAGSPIGGAIVGGGNGFAYMKVFCGVVQVVGTGFIAAARVRLGGW